MLTQDSTVLCGPTSHTESPLPFTKEWVCDYACFQFGVKNQEENNSTNERHFHFPRFEHLFHPSLNLNSTHQELFILALKWGRHDEWLHRNAWEENETRTEAALDLSSRKMLLATVWHSREVSRCLRNQGTVCGEDQGTCCPRITFHMLNAKKKKLSHYIYLSTLWQHANLLSTAAVQILALPLSVMWPLISSSKNNNISHFRHWEIVHVEYKDTHDMMTTVITIILI